MYENIRNGPLKLPNFLSQDAKDLLIAVILIHSNYFLFSCSIETPIRG